MCDAALREAFKHPSATVGKDLLTALQEYAASADRDTPATKAFLDEVHQLPPAGLLATEEEVRVAQELFVDDSIQIMQALLHYSLAGGLARCVNAYMRNLQLTSCMPHSSRIVRTLEAVSYLLPHVPKGKNRAPASLQDVVSKISKESSDRTFVRLLETMQFILDVMGCSAPASPPIPAEHSSGLASGHTGSPSSALASLLPGGEGWKSAVRVRLLHGVARWRVQTRWERDHPAERQSSVPISQEEVAATYVTPLLDKYTNDSDYPIALLPSRPFRYGVFTDCTCRHPNHKSARTSLSGVTSASTWESLSQSSSATSPRQTQQTSSSLPPRSTCSSKSFPPSQTQTRPWIPPQALCSAARPSLSSSQSPTGPR